VFLFKPKKDPYSETMCLKVSVLRLVGGVFILHGPEGPKYTYYNASRFEAEKWGPVGSPLTWR
jgi:hypothetical protein